ncbi:MAG: hypothetical protein ABFS37_14120 [Acidobacteriota bacterium]
MNGPSLNLSPPRTLLSTLFTVAVAAGCHCLLTLSLHLFADAAAVQDPGVHPRPSGAP